MDFPQRQLRQGGGYVLNGQADERCVGRILDHATLEINVKSRKIKRA